MNLSIDGAKLLKKAGITSSFHKKKRVEIEKYFRIPLSSPFYFLLWKELPCRDCNLPSPPQRIRKNLISGKDRLQLVTVTVYFFLSYPPYTWIGAVKYVNMFYYIYLYIY
ncbi:MAG: hypothetical protein IJ013_06035, partial [Bacteroidaceae bacterium]|nr:hypothetical protein [Bacteroidaceae bacterium]